MKKEMPTSWFSPSNWRERSLPGRVLESITGMVQALLSSAPVLPGNERRRPRRPPPVFPYVHAPCTETPDPARGSASLFALLRRRYLELLLEVLVRRAVLAARQRHSLARRSLPCGGVATQRASVERDSCSRLALYVLAGQCHVALDDRVHAHLARDWEEAAHVVEQRPCGTCEVMPVRGEALHGRLARAQEPLTREADVLAQLRHDLR